MGVTVSEVGQADDVVVGELTRLVAQVSSQEPDLIAVMVHEAITSPSSRVLVARVEKTAVGTLTLVTFTIPSGRRAWIEDVVVDEDARRQGVGEALVGAALEFARRDGVRTVDLTSRASRTEAHALYAKVGFQLRDTNVYRLSLER